VNGLVVVPLLAVGAVGVVHAFRWLDRHDRRRRHDAYVQRINAMIAARPENQIAATADDLAAAETLWFHPHPRGGYVSTSERDPWTQP